MGNQVLKIYKSEDIHQLESDTGLCGDYDLNHWRIVNTTALPSIGNVDNWSLLVIFESTENQS